MSSGNEFSPQRVYSLIYESIEDLSSSTRNAFIALEHNRPMVGCQMGYRFVIAVVLLSGILSAACLAQGEGTFQSVGSDFGRAWLKDFQAQNPARQSQAQNSTALWNWGGAPRGSIIQNGLLVQDPYYIWKSLNLTSGWMGQAYVDAKTGYPVYAFVDPYTGYPDYFYVDPKTGKPVYIYSGATTDNSTYGSVPPYYRYIRGPTSPYYPWLGDPSSLPAYDGDYGEIGYAGTGYAGTGMV